MDYIERFGAGKLIRSDLARSDALRDATLRAIDDPRLRERARRVAALVKATRPETEFPSAIRSLLDAMPQTTEKLPT